MDEVLTALHKNLAEHKEIVAEAKIGYVEKCKEEVTKAGEKLAARMTRRAQGEVFDMGPIIFHLTPPDGLKPNCTRKSASSGTSTITSGSLDHCILSMLMENPHDTRSTKTPESPSSRPEEQASPNVASMEAKHPTSPKTSPKHRPSPKDTCPSLEAPEVSSCGHHGSTNHHVPLRPSSTTVHGHDLPAHDLTPKAIGHDRD